MRNFIKAFNESMRPLTPAEINSLNRYFPRATYSDIKFLDNEIMNVNSSDDLCFGVEFGCSKSEREIEVYLSESNYFLETIITQEIEREICPKTKFTCKDSYNFKIQYNCIGFATGIMAISDSDLITGSTPKDAITLFIERNNETYPAELPINAFKISDQLRYVESITDPIKNNTIAFYFKDGVCKHAARYIVDFDFWVSKLGPYILIGHPLLEDLMGEAYGDQIYYAEVQIAGEEFVPVSC